MLSLSSTDQMLIPWNWRRNFKHFVWIFQKTSHQVLKISSVLFKTMELFSSRRWQCYCSSYLSCQQQTLQVNDDHSVCFGGSRHTSGPQCHSTDWIICCWCTYIGMRQMHWIWKMLQTILSPAANIDYPCLGNGNEMLLERHFTPTCELTTELDYITDFNLITKFRRFQQNIATGAASLQRTLTSPDTWSCPIWDLHLFKCWDHPFLNLSCLRTFSVSNIPRYFYFASLPTCIQSQKCGIKVVGKMVPHIVHFISILKIWPPHFWIASYGPVLYAVWRCYTVLLCRPPCYILCLLCLAIYVLGLILFTLLFTALCVFLYSS